MRRFTSIFVAGLLGLAILACGSGTPEPVAPPVVPAAPVAAAEAPCCSAQDVIKMSSGGLSDEVIIGKIKTAPAPASVGVDDLIALKAANVHDPVILALQGSEPAVIAPAGSTPKLSLATDYVQGARSFQLTNRSGVEYSNVRITVNGSYVYALKRLPASSSDSIRLASFVSQTSGQELTAKEGISGIKVVATQGAWSHSY